MDARGFHVNKVTLSTQSFIEVPLQNTKHLEKLKSSILFLKQMTSVVFGSFVTLTAIF